MKRNLSFFWFATLLIVIGLTDIAAQDRPAFADEVYRSDNLDGLEQVPEWLMVQVESALPSEGLNVWVPTGIFASSSLVRVPRFPRASRSIEKISKDQVLELQAVRNEQVSAQLAIAATDTLSDLQVQVSDLKSESGELIPASNVKVRYVKYVPVHRAYTGNTYEDVAGSEGLSGVSGFGGPDVVGDPLIELEKVGVPAFRAQPAWFTVKVPKENTPGRYEGTIKITSDQYGVVKLPIQLAVREYSIPDPQNYKFHMDAFMNPSSLASYYGVEAWSDGHWDLIKKYFANLASLGQKKITTTITEKPWKKPWLNDQMQPQTGTGYQSMVKWVLGSEGEWEFNYEIFDKYVETGLEVGVGPYISAYSMLTFRGAQRLTYLDEQKGKEVTEYLDVKDKRYKEVWTTFLRDFSAHLRQKGWLDQIYLGFDERPPELMDHILKIIENSAPDLRDKIYISGGPDVDKYAEDIKIEYSYFPGGSRSNKKTTEVIKRRNEVGQPIRFYLTCCGDPHPNMYTYSPAIESRMMPWISLKYNLDGYSHWAYNSWPTLNVFEFPVFNYTQGDEYYVYPGLKGPLSSIRWELIKEGIEDFELVQILKDSKNLKNETLERAIDLATRDSNGQKKHKEDLFRARQILFKE